MMDKYKVKSGSARDLERMQKRQYKLNSLKNEFEGDKIKDFSQVFAIFNASPLAIELGIPFYTFKQKIADPGEFTNNELIRLAELVNVEPEIVVKFVFEQIRRVRKCVKKIK